MDLDAPLWAQSFRVNSATSLFYSMRVCKTDTHMTRIYYTFCKYFHRCSTRLDGVAWKCYAMHVRSSGPYDMGRRLALHFQMMSKNRPCLQNGWVVFFHLLLRVLHSFISFFLFSFSFRMRCFILYETFNKSKITIIIDHMGLCRK